VARIVAAGLPVPPKSSCFFCGAIQPDEVRALPSWCLRLIVLIEARAEPRLRTVEGLWRRSTRTKPGKITDFIRAERLLPEAEIVAIRRDAPTDLIRFQDAASLVPISERPTMEAWIETFNAGLVEAARPTSFPVSPRSTIASGKVSIRRHGSSSPPRALPRSPTAATTPRHCVATPNC
jgi:hypothetical protein